jgi:hypothetical protein
MLERKCWHVGIFASPYSNILRITMAIKRPSSIFHAQGPRRVYRDHAERMLELVNILDQAAVEYDLSEDVVNDFTAEAKTWARLRDQKPER